MDAVDLNFTESIVGTPVSVSLGRPLGLRETAGEGVQCGPREIGFRVTRAWADWWTLRTDKEWFGVARRRPGHARLWLERHAFVIAALSLLVLLAEFGVLVAWFAARP